jgi:hypothetical protein
MAVERQGKHKSKEDKSMPPLADLAPLLIDGVGDLLGGAAAAGEAAGSSTFSNFMDGVNLAQNLQNFLPSGQSGASSNSTPSSLEPFSGNPANFTTVLGGGGDGGSGGVDSSGGAGGFDGDFNDLANGADPSNTSSLLGIQTQADQEQTMLELEAKLESMQNQTDQFIVQNL